MIVVMATEATSDSLADIKRCIEIHLKLARVTFRVDRKGVTVVLDTIFPDLIDEIELVPALLKWSHL